MESILELGNSYNDLQKRMGISQEPNWDQEISSLFHPQFTKTANGQILVSGAYSLGAQINQCREDAGCWTIDINEVIASHDNKTCVIHYKINTKKAGSFEVIALLKSNTGKTIESIHEVYYKI